MAKRAIVVVLVTLALFVGFQCMDSGVDARSKGQIVVYVHWGNLGIEQKKVELVQTGEVKYTDKNGLAEFDVQLGSYTVRIYNLQSGGPALLQADFNVEVKPAETSQLDVVECLPCV